MKYKIKLSNSFIFLMLFIAFTIIVGAVTFTSNNQLQLNQTEGLKMGNTSANGTHIITDTIQSYNLSSPSNIINASNTSITNTSNLRSSASYIISKCSWNPSLTCAENGTTRNLDYTNTDSATVINLALTTAGTPPQKEIHIYRKFHSFHRNLTQKLFHNRCKSSKFHIAKRSSYYSKRWFSRYSNGKP